MKYLFFLSRPKGKQNELEEAVLFDDNCERKKALRRQALSSRMWDARTVTVSSVVMFVYCRAGKGNSRRNRFIRVKGKNKSPATVGVKYWMCVTRKYKRGDSWIPARFFFKEVHTTGDEFTPITAKLIVLIITIILLHIIITYILFIVLLIRFILFIPFFYSYIILEGFDSFQV